MLAFLNFLQCINSIVLTAFFFVFVISRNELLSLLYKALWEIEIFSSCFFFVSLLFKHSWVWAHHGGIEKFFFPNLRKQLAFLKQLPISKSCWQHISHVYVAVSSENFISVILPEKCKGKTLKVETSTPSMNELFWREPFTT